MHIAPISPYLSTVAPTSRRTHESGPSLGRTSLGPGNAAPAAAPPADVDEPGKVKHGKTPRLHLKFKDRLGGVKINLKFKDRMGDDTAKSLLRTVRGQVDDFLARAPELDGETRDAVGNLLDRFESEIGASVRKGRNADRLLSAEHADHLEAAFDRLTTGLREIFAGGSTDGDGATRSPQEPSLGTSPVRVDLIA